MVCEAASATGAVPAAQRSRSAGVVNVTAPIVDEAVSLVVRNDELVGAVEAGRQIAGRQRRVQVCERRGGGEGEAECRVASGSRDRQNVGGDEGGAVNEVVRGRRRERSRAHRRLGRITGGSLQHLVGDRLRGIDQLLHRGDAGIGSLQNLHAVANTVEQVVDVAGAVVEALRGEEVGRVVESRIDLVTSCKAVLRGGEQVGRRLEREQVLAN